MNFMASTKELNRPVLSAATVVDEVQRRWPDAKLEFPETGVYEVMWSVRSGDTLFKGGFFRNGRTLALDGDLEEIADFAIWFQQVAGVPIVFYDEAYSADVEVHDGMTAAELESTWCVQPPLVSEQANRTHTGSCFLLAHKTGTREFSASHPAPIQ